MGENIKNISIGIFSFFCLVIILSIWSSILYFFIYGKYIGYHFLGLEKEFAFLFYFLYFILPASFILSIFIAWKRKKAIIIISILILLGGLLMLIFCGINDYKKELESSTSLEKFMIDLDKTIVETAEKPNGAVCFFQTSSPHNDCSKMSCKTTGDISYLDLGELYLHSFLEPLFDENYVETWRSPVWRDGAIVRHQKEFYLFNVIKDSETGNLKIFNYNELSPNHETFPNRNKDLFMKLDYTSIYEFNKTYLSSYEEGQNIKNTIESLGCKNGIYIENQGKNTEGKQILLVVDNNV